MLIAFIINDFCVRGTEAVTFAYAHYNEVLLGNKSVIVHRPDVGKGRVTPDVTQSARDMFTQRFQVYSLPDRDIDALLAELGVDVCVVSCYGVPTYMPWSVPTVAHCVFRADLDLGSSLRVAVSNWVSKGAVRVLPNVIDLDPSDGTDLRAELGIPPDAFVFGRHGGWETFDVPWARDVVAEVAAARPDVYFVFMHTQPFPAPPNVKFIEGTVDRRRKRKFIDTCDAMVHARQMGETFGCAVGEFAVCGKPVVTVETGDLAHVQILGDRAVVARGPQDLAAALMDTKRLESIEMRGNGFEAYLPHRIMPLLQIACVEAMAKKYGASLPLVYE